MSNLPFERFVELAATANLIPVWRDILLDTDTAVAAFAKVRRPPFAFLLESAPAGGETWARYTFLGTEPREAWRVTDNIVERWLPDEGWLRARAVTDPISELQQRIRAERPAHIPELGAFWGGAVGYFAYDMVRTIERLPRAPTRTSSAPDAQFIFTSAVIILDNLLGQARIVVSVPVADAPSRDALRTRYDVARETIDALVDRLREPTPLHPLVLEADAPPAVGTSRYERSRFEADVRRIQEYIAAGDCFQALLSRRIVFPHDFDSSSLYRALRALNPSPYMYHLVLDGIELVGSSPELLVRVADGKVVVRPIAGTRPRGSREEDAARAAELLADEKERAEHLMLVDLGRNDVGRVSSYGSVKVTELMAVERYSHVLHLVSEVEGVIREGLSALDVFRATFPAGTMTGAPKVRAMEIIDEFEPERRGPYAGAVGYIAAGDERMDLAITIRTCVIADGLASVQAGAGIVADSVPAREWEETESKARALQAAIGRVRGRR